MSDEIITWLAVFLPILEHGKGLLTLEVLPAKIGCRSCLSVGKGIYGWGLYIVEGLT